MRVMNRAEFLKQPAGIWYAKGKPWAFDGLQIKEDSIPAAGTGDWFYLDPCWIDSGGVNSIDDAYRMDEMLETGESSPMEEAITRDGCFDQADVFLVFGRSDLKKLMEKLAEAIVVSGPWAPPST